MANLIPLSKSEIVKYQKTGAISTNKFFASDKKTKVNDINTKKESPKLLESTLSKIEKKVIKIDNLLKDSLALRRKKTKVSTKEKEDKTFAEREKELEKNKPKPVKGVKLPTAAPKLGLFDWIKNFIFNTILGYFAVKYFDQLPKLLKLIPTILKVGESIIDFAGSMLDGLVTFVDWGYKAIDGTRGFMKDIGGEGLAKNFDKFAGAIDNVLEVAIIAALATADSGGGFCECPKPGGGRPGRGGRGSDFKDLRKGFKGKQGWNLSWERATNPSRGFSHLNAERDIMKRYFQRFGRDAFIERFGKEGLEALPGGMARSGATVGIAGKGGAKTILKTVRPLLKRIPLPVVGALIDFGLSWALGEDPGRAAFKAIGAGILGGIGTALGGAIGLAGGPLSIAGAMLGGLAGGTLGDMAGGALYDMFFGGKKPQQPKGKVVKAAGGGKPATRGGKLVGGPSKRTLKKKKTPRTLRATPTKLRPGTAIGGEKEIKKLYPESKDKTKMSPFDFLKNSYENFSKSTGLETLISFAIKPLMGDKLTYVDYKNAGIGINNWMNQTVSSGTLAYAGGGEVKMESIVSGEDYSDVIAKSLQDSVAPQVDKTIQDLMKQLMLKPNEVQKEKPPGQDPNELAPGEELGNATEMVGGARLLMSAGFPPLSAAVISSVIQAESAWKGQRTPWVLNDGAGTNKGLISWNRTRITNAEKFLGKPLETASNAEQVRWIKEELKQYGLLDDMMNPQATEEQLKSSIYKYVVWNRRYDADHWKNISKIRTALERGEKGSYTDVPSGGSPNIGAGDGKLRFGRTGSMSVAPGYSHAHFDTVNGTPQSVIIRDTIPLLKKMASSGLKPELADTTPILAGKNNEYYTNIIKSGIAQHTHRPGPRFDVNMPGFPLVPFKLSDVRNTPTKGEGINGLVPGSGKTALFHLGTKSTGYAFHGKPAGIVPKDGFMLKLHKGEMYKVIDKDSVDLLGIDLARDVIEIENRAQLVARAPSIIQKLKAISGYTDYEQPEIQYVEVPVPIEIPIEVPIPMGSGGVGGGGVNSNNTFDRLAIG